MPGTWDDLVISRSIWGAPFPLMTYIEKSDLLRMNWHPRLEQPSDHLPNGTHFPRARGNA